MERMKIAILGATGPTGRILVSEALDKGLSVVAVVRNPEKIKIQHDNLKVAIADLKDPSQLVAPFTGCNAVLSLVGGQTGFFTPCDVYSEVGKSAVAAMRECGVKRLIYVTAWATKVDRDTPWWWRFVLRNTYVRQILPDMEKVEDFVVTQCPDITYTFVKPPYLRDWPRSKLPLQISVGQFVTDYETQELSREDLAVFMLSCLETADYHNKLVSITGRKKN